VLKCYYCHQEGHFKQECPQRVNQNRNNWNQNRGNWNSNNGKWNQNRGNWNQGRPNNNWGKGPSNRGRGGFRGRGQYNGPRYQNGENRSWQESQGEGSEREDRSQAEAQRVRQNIIKEGRPKASWVDPPLPAVVDDQPALAADHAEANFTKRLSASDRWKSETSRAPMMYEQAMAQMANMAPMVPSMELPRVDFLRPN